MTIARCALALEITRKTKNGQIENTDTDLHRYRNLQWGARQPQQGCFVRKRIGIYEYRCRLCGSDFPDVIQEQLWYTVLGFELLQIIDY